jgi:crossover junction endodeoxyribonuclease RusA
MARLRAVAAMTREWRLDLPYIAPPLSMNQRLHWAKRHRVKTELQTAVHVLLRHHKVPALDDASVWIEWTPGVTRRRDTDNPEPTRKAAIDAIVAAGLLPDDTPEYVQRPENRILPVNRGKPSLVLVIRDGFQIYAQRNGWDGCE